VNESVKGDRAILMRGGETAPIQHRPGMGECGKRSKGGAMKGKHRDTFER
jgi:hypothetical protein